MNPTNEEIKQYLRETVDYLDGQGLIVTDWDLIKEALDENDPYGVLREMFEVKE